MHTTYPSDLSAPGAVEALLAHHRARFGGARMQDDDGGDQQGDGDEPKRPDGESKPQGEDRAEKRDDLGDGGKRALEAERRAARAEKRRADEAERQLDEMRRAQMNDQQRAEAERDDWRKKYEEQAAELAARDLDILRRDVAAEKGLNPALARRLQGVSREELEADADDLRSQFATPPPPGAVTPKPDPSQGSGHDKRGGRPTSVADAMREAREARAQRSGTNT